MTKTRCACPSDNPYECTDLRLGEDAEGDELCQCSCHIDWFVDHHDYIEKIIGEATE